MRYLLFALIAITITAGAYFALSSQFEEKYEIMEEDTNPACEISVLIYNSPYCRYCTMAKDLLDTLKIPYETIDVNTSQSKRAEMIERTGRSTIPQIYINDQHIGGYDDLKALKDAGKLQKFIETCNTAELK